MTDLQYSTIL